jgi:hypothetical protein
MKHRVFSDGELDQPVTLPEFENTIDVYQATITNLAEQQQKFKTDLLTTQHANAELKSRMHAMESTHGLIAMNARIFSKVFTSLRN